MLLGTLGASLLGNILAGKGLNRAGEVVIAMSISQETKSMSQGVIRAGYGNKKVEKQQKTKWIFNAASSFNFEIQK